MITVVFAVLFALAIGPETPLSAPSIEAAAGDQTKPSLAWYGDSLAAAWIDRRENEFPEVRIAQLDALGRPKGPAVRAYGDVADTRLAANGAATPLIATCSGNFNPTAVGAAGTSGRYVAGFLDDLVTDGSTYLLLTTQWAAHPEIVYWPWVHAEVLDSKGYVIATANFGERVSGVIAVPFGGAYHVIYRQSDELYDTIVQTDGTVSSQLIANGLPLETPVSVVSAAAGDRLLIAWNTPASIELRMFTSSRTLLMRRSLLVSATRLFAGSDGNEFLIAWNDTESLKATRANADGVAVGETFTLGSQLAGDLDFARTPQGVVLAWSDGQPRNIFTRGAASFAGIAAAPTTLASVGYAQQDELSLDGMPVWVEGEAHTRITSAAGPIAEAASGHRLRQPVAARGAGSTLVAWRDVGPDGHAKAMAKFNDDAPIVISDTFAADLDVVFDGSSFLVFWTDDNLHRTRFTTGGAQLETSTIATTGRVSALSAARIGDKAAVAWIDNFTLFYEGRPVTTLSSKPQLAADDRNQPFLAWAEGNCVKIAHRVDDALFVVQSLYCNSRTFVGSAAVAWNGTEFVIAWYDTPEEHYRNVHYMRTERNGAPLDKEPLDVSGRFRDTFAPSLVPSAAGVTLGYARTASEVPFDDVSRVFARTIERLGMTPRERAIGR
ncbi:MAG TPA: hypothetical protein VJ901_09185 [Thermoanaerobaculia bacterium]|nr:hypothetical protein [Thermoanaerobaculia bacterium]